MKGVKKNFTKTAYENLIKAQETMIDEFIKEEKLPKESKSVLRIIVREEFLKSFNPNGFKN